jgi:hypothetical protein
MAGDAAADVEATNFINLPTMFIGAGGNATAFDAKVKELGYGNCTLKSDGTAADVWAWVKQTTRVSNPAKIVYKPGPQQNRAYWLGIPNTEGIKNPILAECDRATNTIKVTTNEVVSVTFLLNGAMVDFGRKINFEINGQASSELIAPSITDLIVLAETKSDSGAAYVALRTKDVK